MLAKLYLQNVYKLQQKLLAEFAKQVPEWRGVVRPNRWTFCCNCRPISHASPCA